MRVNRSQHGVRLGLMEAGNVFMVPTGCQRLATLESHGSVNKGLAVRGLTGAGPAPLPLVTTPFRGTKLPLKKQSQAALGGLVTPTSALLLAYDL